MDNKDLEETLLTSVKFDERGLVPVVVQVMGSNIILMLAYANEEALNITLKEGYATFWSRSRKEIWRKGETSGDRLKIYEVLIDCDQDSLVYRVFLEGRGACHTMDKNGSSRKSCFYRKFLNRDIFEYLSKEEQKE